MRTNWILNKGHIKSHETSRFILHLNCLLGKQVKEKRQPKRYQSQLNIDMPKFNHLKFNRKIGLPECYSGGNKMSTFAKSHFSNR